MKIQTFSFLKIVAIISFFIALFGLAVIAPTLAGAKEQNNNNLVSVLIGFDKKVGASEKALVRTYGGEIKHSYSIVNAIAAQMPESALKGLSNNPNITAVEQDLEVRAVDIEEEYANIWSLSNIKARPVHQAGNTGIGAKIGIIDSGINYNHPDLAGNYAGGHDFVENENDLGVREGNGAMDVYGHGTHVAGTACAVQNGFGAVGVAPDCILYSLRVLNDAGSGNTSDILAAVQWAVDNDLDVINLSLGRSSDMGSIAQTAFENAYNTGVLIVAAAGNSGNPPGKGTNTIYPANYDSVIAVAATDINNKRASFSSTGANVELAAPGVSVYSTWNDNTSYSNPQPECFDYNSDTIQDCYKEGSGTSMASPHVAGVAALVFSGGIKNNQQVRTILQDTAFDLGTAGRDAHYGYGLVDAQKAVNGIVISDKPIADAGADQIVIDQDADGFADVILDGGGSYDQSVGGSIVWYEWSEGASSIASTTLSTATVTLPLGDHTIMLKVTDNDGLIAEDSVLISVIPYSAPEPSTKFSDGDRVKAQRPFNIRTEPTTSASAIGQTEGKELGIITFIDDAHADPVYADGYWWWYVIWDSGKEGWSVENWMRINK
jgi:subtilisin family serine protease